MTAQAPGHVDNALQSPRFGELTRPQCEQLLRRARVGRLAYSLHDRVDIAPIRFVFDGVWVYGRTAPGGKLASILTNRWVALEIDEHRGAFDWLSVVVHGSFYLLVPDPGAAGDADGTALIKKYFPRALGADDPTPFRNQFFRIHVSEITGRYAEPTGGSRREPEPS
ncbi:MAG: pyridoxamine 5'-phosphate oxidase family protein [Gemmatimonadales bacterium]